MKQKITFSILGSLIAIGAGMAVSAVGEAPIPEHLQLKVSKERILGSNEVKNNVIKYAYNSGVRITTEPSDKAVAQAQKHNLGITSELIEKRTKHSKTFKTNNPKKFVSEFISGVPQYYEDENNEWWQAEYATTTKEAFNMQMKISLLDRIFNKIALATTDTFYPDDDSETSTVDGWVRHYNLSGDTWGNIHDGAGVDSADNVTSEAAPNIEGQNSTQWRMIFRGVYLFNTGSIIGATDIIDSATMSIRGDVCASCDGLGINHGINIYSSNPASNLALVAADYTTLGTTEYAATILYSSWNENGYNDFTLNVNGRGAIAKGSGVTKFGTRESEYDAPDIEPVSVSAAIAGFNARYAEYIGTDSDPRLVVVYSTITTKAARKDVDQSVSSLTTGDLLQNDNDLQLSLGDSKSYIIDGLIFATSLTVRPNIKIGFKVPEGAIMDIAYVAHNSRDSGVLESPNTPSPKINLMANDNEIIQINGTVKTSVTAGTLVLQWAQNTSLPALTTVKAGSYLRVEPIP